MERRDHWIVDGIVIKVVTKKAGEEFYNKKGVILEVKNKYEAVVCLIDGNDEVTLHQSDLRTVLPAIGKENLLRPKFYYYFYFIFIIF